MRYPGSTVAESAHHQAGARRAAGWAGQEVNVNERRARELVAGERSRVEAALAGLNSEIHDEGSLQRQQTGEYEDAASALDAESVSVALAADLLVERRGYRIVRNQLDGAGNCPACGAPIPGRWSESAP